MPVANEKPRAQIAQLRQLYEQDLLSEDTYREALARLGVDPEEAMPPGKEHDEWQDDSAGVSHAMGTADHTTYHVHVEQAYGLAIGDRAQAGTAPGGEEAALDDEIARTQYLHHIIEVNRRLQLQGIRSAGHLVSIDLEEVYVTLAATERRTIACEGATAERFWEVEPDEMGEASSCDEVLPREMVMQVKVKVQEALAAHPRLVVLGDPGSGKTTLLRYLALTYARDLSGEVGLVAQRLEISEQRLPILLPLRDFASYLKENYPDPSTDGPKLLLDYLDTFLENQDISLPKIFFVSRLRRGECVALLDGMDEVADLAIRHRVARIVERFTIAYPDNRYVVTSRIVGYIGSARLDAGYFVTTVHGFTQADIERFATYWNHAVETALAGGETPSALVQAQRQTKAILDSIHGNERIRDLAVNPLLLTVIALVQRYRARLPERRTELYEEAIEVLLGKWDEAKQLDINTMLPGQRLDAGDRRSLLEPIALWMMEHRVQEIEAQDLHRQMEERFLSMTGGKRQADKATREFLQLIRERSGLLTERGQGIYAFSHLTFQEHLAARAVADRPDYIPYTLARLGDNWWREVVLLEAGYLSTQGKQRVTALIQAIMDFRKQPEPYHNLILAAAALRDVGLARVDGDLSAEIRRRIRKDVDRDPVLLAINLIEEKIQTTAIKYLIRLVKWFFPGDLRAPMLRLISMRGPRRNTAARALSQLGGVYWTAPYGEPDWVDIPAGEFWMGSNSGLDWERPLHQVHLEAFQIARVPVSNAQYLLFVKATGYRPPKNWEGDRPRRDLENHPVDCISHDDALAYCQWLSQVTGKSITLPTEAQWEKAARGNRDQREYPWGNDWVKGRCNSLDLGLGDTTPVGIFPEGASPYGVLDMAGNVWERTSSLWGTNPEKPLFAYPYDPSDGRETNSVPDGTLFVFRGGSFLDLPDGIRCTYRNRPNPYDVWRGNGFRVVVSLEA